MAALGELKGYEDEDGPDEDEEGKEAIYLDHGDKGEAIDAGNKVGQKRLNWIWLFECGLSNTEQTGCGPRTFILRLLNSSIWQSPHIHLPDSSGSGSAEIISI